MLHQWNEVAWTITPHERNGTIPLLAGAGRHNFRSPALAWARDRDIPLAAGHGSTHFRSPARAWARDRGGLEQVPRQALEQGRQLRRAQAHHAFRWRGPVEPLVFFESSGHPQTLPLFPLPTLYD